jgi:hypothetical protein
MSGLYSITPAGDTIVHEPYILMCVTELDGIWEYYLVEAAGLDEMPDHPRGLIKPAESRTSCSGRCKAEGRPGSIGAFDEEICSKFKYRGACIEIAVQTRLFSERKSCVYKGVLFYIQL